jgi:SAM-dependent methyltransferase
MVADGVTWEILDRDLWALYDSLANDRPMPAKSALEFADLVAWEQELTSAASFASDVAFWRKRLDGAEPVGALAQHGLAGDAPFHFHRALTTSEMADLGRQSRALRVSGAGLLTTVYARALAAWSGQPDVCIQCPTDLRLWYPELGPTTGMLLRSVLMRVRAAPESTLAESCASTSAALIDVAVHGNVPLDVILETPVPTSHPLARALVILFQPERMQFLAAQQEGKTGEHAPLSFEDIELPQTEGPRASVVAVITYGDGDSWIHLTGAPGIFDRTKFDGFVGFFERALDEALAIRTTTPPAPPSTPEQRALAALDFRDHFDDRLRVIDQIDRFDETFGLDTSRPVEPWEVAEADEQVIANNARYSPTPVRTIRCALDASTVVPDSGSFVDFGCGKGRVLLVASEYSFRKIIGVEFSRELADTAQQNIDRFRSDRQKCRDLEVRCVDAREFSIPDDGVLFYFYEPFSEAIAEEVFANIVTSARRNPRKMELVLVGKVLDPLAERLPYLTLVRSAVSPDDPWYNARIYSVKP